MRLDRTDFEILRALQNDARLSNKELATRVGLAPSSCLERVRRLREGGVLRGFHADVAPEAVGVGLQAMIAIQLSRHSRASFDSIRAHLLSRPEVVGLFHVAGRDDFLLHVAVRDSDHLRDLTWQSITTRPEIAHIETSVIFDHLKAPGWPMLADEAE
ncbi:MAG: Lrp/AsnC family transcriptional regulator [Planctomycetota bacterium]